MNLEQPQVLICLLCYNALINGSNPRTNARKVLVAYYKTNDILSLKKHFNVFGSFMSNFFSMKVSFKKDDILLKKFDEDLGLLIIEINLQIRFVESICV